MNLDDIYCEADCESENVNLWVLVCSHQNSVIVQLLHRVESHLADHKQYQSFPR